MTDFDKLIEVDNRIAELEDDREGLSAIVLVMSYLEGFFTGHMVKLGCDSETDPVIRAYRMNSGKSKDYLLGKLDKINDELQSLYMDRDYWQGQVAKGEDE